MISYNLKNRIYIIKLHLILIRITGKYNELNKDINKTSKFKKKKQKRKLSNTESKLNPENVVIFRKYILYITHYFICV